jgi:hypothetical protein
MPQIMRLFIVFLLAIITFSSCQTNKSSQPTTTTQVQKNSTPIIIHDLKDSLRINVSIFIRRDATSFVEYKMLKPNDTIIYNSREVDLETARIRMFRSTLSLLDETTVASMAKLTFYSEDNKEIKSESTDRPTTQEAELYSGCCTSTTPKEFVSEAYYATMKHYFSNRNIKDSVEVYIKF